MSELARVFEGAGLVTTGIVLIKEHAQRVCPPRMLSVPFNFGNTLGEANNPDFQHEVLDSAFALLDNTEGPVLTDFEAEFVPDPIIQGSQVVNMSGENGATAKAELNSFTEAYEKWVRSNDGRTGVGLSTIHHVNFPLIIDFLEDFIDGKTRDSLHRPSDISLAHFLRYCVDDLKAFAFESQMSSDENMNINQLHEWFWTKTSMAELILRLKKCMSQDTNTEIKAEAFGIAR